MYQQVVLVGNVGVEPAMSYTPEGTPVTNFTVATNRRWRGADGEQREKTVWFRVVAWKHLAEVCAQMVRKGMLVLVVGELSEPRLYQAKSGEWRASLEITATTIKFLGGKEGVEDIEF